MTKWAYLLTEQFQTRYAVAAYLLRDCEQIIEIGGYKTPISSFIKDKRIDVIDPEVCHSFNPMAQHHAIDFQDWKPAADIHDYGLLLLGMDIKGESCLDKLCKLINGSIKTVIGIPANYSPSVDQLVSLLNKTQKKVTFKIAMDFRDDPYGTRPTHEQAGPHGLRHIYLLE